MPRPYLSNSPTAAESGEGGLTTTEDGATVAQGAMAMIQFAAGSGHVMGGAR